MTSDDMALVREYAKNDSEQAFATLVSRHINLVYSVALLHAHDTHLAEEIAQGVFIILARKAKSLSPTTILSGWLCRTARYVSSDTLKIQRRRQFREQESHMQSISNQSDSAAWNEIAPLLDEALNCLGEKECDAVVLRFFEGKGLKQVGAALGTGEDAARMRVNRGVEKLRAFFTRKGVTLSAAAITGAISANSIQAAPAGLAATITASALSGTTITTAAVIAATKTIAMTTLQKTVITTVLAAAVGTGIYEARQVSRLREQNQTLLQQQAPLAGQIKQLQSQLDAAAGQLPAPRTTNEGQNQNTDELLRLRGEVALLRRQLAQRSNDSIEATAETWANRADQLKQWVAQTPNETIPELQLLSDSDWLQTVGSLGNWDGTNSLEFLASELRKYAKEHLGRGVAVALGDFIVANNGMLPNDTSQLQPYLNPQSGITDAMLQRYGMLQSGNVSGLKQTEPLIAESEPIQTGQYDALFKIGVLSFNYQNIVASGESGSGGVVPTHPDELKKLFGSP